MRNRFGEVFNARLRQNILSIIAIVLFLFALGVTIFALVKTPDINEVKQPSASTDDPSKPADPDKPNPPASGSISTFHEITDETSITDEEGGMTIEVVADALLRQFIMAASDLDSTSYKVTSIQSVRPVIFDQNSTNPGIYTATLNANTWFVNATSKVVCEGKLTTDANGESSLGGRYIVKKGNTYTLYAQSVYEALPPEEIPSFVWGEYDASTPIATAEMTLSNGVKLAMTYEQVEAKMGAFDSVDTSVARTRTAVKNGYTFTVSLVDSTSTSATDWGLPHDGKYYLTQVIADETCTDEFPRGIKIGDAIENVFTKFPTANTKLQKWKEQRLYGASSYVEGKTYCMLEYRTSLGSYRIIAYDTERDYIAIAFDKSNNVKSFEWTYRQ